nr:hypothetical protein [Marinobacter sp. SS8-8]|tara:strand:+ start:13850 stop:14116 length:267 start_codon:yes stop_codon:yes gene_type:complete
MAAQVLALVLVLFVANMSGLWLFHRWQPMAVERPEGEVSPGHRRLFLAGLKPLLAVMAGLRASGHCLRLSAVVSVASADGGVSGSGIN